MVLWHWKIITSTLLLSAVIRSESSVNFSSRNNHEYLYESKLIMRSLEDVLKYLEKRPEAITSDVILGVLIGKANISWINHRLKYHFSSNPWTKENVEQLLRQCRDIIEFKNNFFNVSLLNSSLWEGTAEDLKFGFLNQFDDKFFLPEVNNYPSIDAYMMKGTPEESDYCISELIHLNCQISEYCWLSEINGDSHSGYKTSHRLLYFQILIRMKCDKINPKKFSSGRKIKKKLCQQMLLEASELFENPNLSVTRDLFMEQIALCGLEGYEEFAPATWRHRVRKWQNHNGCFGLEMDSKNFSSGTSDKINVKKRTDSVIDDCHTHVTAVAVPALAFFLRVTLKMAFYLPEGQTFYLVL